MPASNLPPGVTLAMLDENAHGRSRHQYDDPYGDGPPPCDQCGRDGDLEHEETCPRVLRGV